MKVLLVLSIIVLSACGSKKPPQTDPTPTDSIVPWGIQKVQALEAMAVADGSDITVCVADTGTDMDHPDLKDQLVGGTSHIPGNDSWDDNQGHGTHVAGTIAATKNERDVVGVSQAKIFTAKVLDSRGSGMGSWIAAGIVSCVENGAQIISMSLGSPAKYGADPLISDAVKFAHDNGVYTVCAAGNDSKDVGFPAQECDYAVTATDSNDRLAYFSSRGPTADIAAPGVGVVSTKMGGGVESLSGTSMATPHVSGALALALSAGNDELAVDDIGLSPEEQGKGRLNALESVR